MLNLDKKKKEDGIKIGVITREMIDWQVRSTLSERTRVSRAAPGAPDVHDVRVIREPRAVLVTISCSGQLSQPRPLETSAAECEAWLIKEHKSDQNSVTQT